MRSLVTGIGGFAGSHLTDHLLAQGEEDIWGVIHRSAGHARAFADRVHLVTVDLRDPDAVHKVFEKVQPTHVYHLAGQAFVPVSWKDPWATLEANVRSQLNILQALVTLGVGARVLVVGSNEEYGHVAPESLPISEEVPFRPDSPYGVSKVAQDMLGLQYFISHQVYAVRVRPFNHIGPRQNDRFVAASFARQIAEIEAGLRPPIMHVGNLAAQRDFTDVRDTVRAYRLALLRGRAGEVYNVGGGKPRPAQEILDGLLSLSRHEIQVEEDPTRLRPADVPVSYCDPGKLRRHTGWEPSIPFEQSLRDILDDWRGRIAAPESADKRIGRGAEHALCQKGLER